jgi:hypothetical protein
MIRIPAELRGRRRAARGWRSDSKRSTVPAVRQDGSTRIRNAGPLESWLQDLLPSVRGRAYLRTRADAAAYRTDV